MAHAGEDDREAIDRAFADLVAGYHLTAERPNAADALRTRSAEPAPAAEPDESWAAEHPLFRFTEPMPVVEPAPNPSPEQLRPPAAATDDPSRHTGAGRVGRDRVRGGAGDGGHVRRADSRPGRAGSRSSASSPASPS